MRTDDSGKSSEAAVSVVTSAAVRASMVFSSSIEARLERLTKKEVFLLFTSFLSSLFSHTLESAARGKSVVGGATISLAKWTLTGIKTKSGTKKLTTKKTAIRLW